MTSQVLERHPTGSGGPATSGAGRQVWADVAKGVCILLVVLHHLVHKQLHLVVPPGHEHWQAAWAEVTWALKPIRMPLFFLISGMFAAGAVHRPWPRVRKRVLSPAWLYVVWLLLLSAFYLVETRTPANRVHSPGELATELLLPSTSLWFLYAMTAYLLLARALRGLPPALVVAAAFAISASVSWWGIDANNRVAVLSHFVYFAAGAHYPHLVRRVADARIPLLPLAATFALAAFAVSALEVPLSVSVTGLSLLGLPLGLVASRRLSQTAAARPLAWLGSRTLPVYVLHLVVIGALASLPLRMAADPGPLDGVVVAAYPIVGALAVTAICLVLHRALGAARLGALFRAPRWVTG
ncbi:acyltransferase family protein [Nocardioides jiangxiensis]|uniref:Acyltransferase family protein n=1 Tax=Nocardioides jiangxiensis TaxID=3064524 RepID=A0ABT9B6I6_9ACTN|nr:acyltransferase family protein [Nocardioides sp. WY-20]MDO7868921.1 acyltransferase family protein [Nocardioides sp. WY-20]